MLKYNAPNYFKEHLEKKLQENSKLEAPLAMTEIIKKEVVNQCKIPLIPWKEYQDRHPTEQEINQWFDDSPDANIGIITGKISNLVVFDLDSEGAVEYAEDEGGFPDTVKVKTGKGYHIYMQYPGFEVRGSVNKKLDIDIRADGGYVVAPPSVHGSGNIYEWKEGCSIYEIDPAPCTPWMIAYLEDVAKNNKLSTKKKENRTKTKAEGTQHKSEIKNEYLDILKNGCGEGERNSTATKLIGHLLKTKMPPGEVWEIIKLWNQKNTPPIDGSELSRTFNSVSKLESQNKEKKVDVADFLDTTKRIIVEHGESYVRIPFAGKNLSRLEAQMNGGLIGGRFYLLGGIPSASKTMLVNNLADNICLNGQPVLFFSYDDGKTELRYRSFARFSGYGIEDFNQNRLSKSEIKTVCEIPEIQKIMALKYVVEKRVNIEKWSGFIEQVKNRHKKAPVIIIDYLRKLRTDNKTSDERMRVDDILSNLTELAKRYNIPVLVISELARDSYKSGQRLSMASFKESGTIEYEASWLGVLAAVEEKDGNYNLKINWERIIEQDGNVDLIVFKVKRGTGVTGKIPLKVDKNKMTVKDRIDENKFDSVTKLKNHSIYD
jgi:replicative DNA helicase